MMLKRNRKFQQGVVLITGLIFLLVLTILGISTMGSSSIAERMSKNFQDTSYAFSSAEAALSDGESWVKKQTTITTGVASCTTPPCYVWQYDTFGNIATQSDSWWQSTAIPFSSTIQGVASQPRYVIEFYSYMPYELSPDARSKGEGYYYYRITARGTGKAATTRATVQSIYSTQF